MVVEETVEVTTHVLGGDGMGLDHAVFDHKLHDISEVYDLSRFLSLCANHFNLRPRARLFRLSCRSPLRRWFVRFQFHRQSVTFFILSENESSWLHRLRLCAGGVYFIREDEGGRMNPFITQLFPFAFMYPRIQAVRTSSLTMFLCPFARNERPITSRVCRYDFVFMYKTGLELHVKYGDDDDDDVGKPEFECGQSQMFNQNRFSGQVSQ